MTYTDAILALAVLFSGAADILRQNNAAAIEAQLNTLSSAELTQIIEGINERRQHASAWKFKSKPKYDKVTLLSIHLRPCGASHRIIRRPVLELIS